MNRVVARCGLILVNRAARYQTNPTSTNITIIRTGARAAVRPVVARKPATTALVIRPSVIHR